MRRRLQMIFQDPIASLNPRPHIGDIIAEPLVDRRASPTSARARPPRRDVLEAVGLDPDVVLDRRRTSSPAASASASASPAHWSSSPSCVICDEPVSALDVSIQAQILNLLEEMKARYGLTLLFIAHDLAVVKAVATASR